MREIKKASNSENPEMSDVHKQIKEFALLINSTNKKPASKPKKPKTKDSNLKKREKKSEKKVVQFSEKIEAHYVGERSWNDYKKQSKVFKTGSFTIQEIESLKNALCEYASQKQHA